MKKISLLALVLAFGLSSFDAGATTPTSTINPAVPAQNSALSSAVLRANFQAAVNDVNALWTAVTSVFTSSTAGIVPASGGGTTTFLRADGTWATPSGSGSGTVTSFGFTNGNGASGTVSNSTTTPTLLLTPTVGGSFASSNNNLGFFAPTTSAQLAGVLSDETGTGSVVFSTSPTLVTPNIGVATGSLTGNASTASALASTPSLCSTGSAPTGILANGNATGCAVIGGGSGTVTTVSVATANGVSGTVANATTTPAITLTLGAITPTTVVSSGAQTASNFVATGATADTLPVGTTGQRPTAAEGMLRDNTTLHAIEAYVNGAWTSLGSGGAVSVTAATPNILISPTPGTGTFTVGTTNSINNQTGTSYTIQTTDNAQTILQSNASATAYSLPAATTTGFTSGFGTLVYNKGAGVTTITPTTSTINGQSSLALSQYQGAFIFSDASNNYQAFLGGASTAAGAGATNAVQYNGGSSLSGTTVVNNAVLTTGTGGVPVETSMAANGDLLIGSASGAPTATTLTAGSNITITNAANSITIAASSSASTNLGTSTSAVSPQISGDATSGFYTPAASTVAVAAGGKEVEQWNTATSAVNHLSVTPGATTVSPTITEAGTDTAGAGIGLNITAATATTTGAGGPITITSGSGLTTGAGGAVLIQSGGSFGGAAAAPITLTPGTAQGSVTGGALNLNGGLGGSTGGPVNITGGQGTGSSSANGGTVTIVGGPTPYSGVSAGPVVLHGGDAVAANVGAGATTIRGGNGTTTAASAALTLNGGNGGTTSAGSNVTITGGNGGSTSGNAGSVTLVPGTVVSGTAGGIGLGTATPTAATIQAQLPIKLMGYTYSTLPSGSVGDMAYITDQTAACVYGSTPVGSGSNVCKVWYNGTAWIDG